jgi:nicotinate-nucleotide pyrophosphorylase (carboxylating)
VKVDLELIRHFLAEDIGPQDVTCELIAPTATAVAEVITREEMVVCGKDWFEAVFWELDKRVEIKWAVEEGQEVAAGAKLCHLKGPARALLSGERTALNLLQTLAGTATVARRFAQAVAGTQAIVLDTRKTIPGLRLLQKYAVKVGGCTNHRLGLYDGILLKENHLAVLGEPLRAAVARAKALYPELAVEVEIESLAQLQEGLSCGAEILLLDNFSLEELGQAVAMARRVREKHPVPLLEASGNITLDNIRQVAATGVDRISVGSLTKHLKAIDLSLRVVEVSAEGVLDPL